VRFLPVSPGSVLRVELGKKAFEIFSLNTHESVGVGVPHRFRLFIVENKGILISPPRRREGENMSIYLAAVHSR